MNSFLIRSSWHLLWGNIWSPLSKKDYATDTMFLELYLHQSKKLRLKIVREVYDNPKIAQEEFKKKIVPIKETVCISLLEGFYEVLSNIDARLCYDYRTLLGKFIERYNLRYFLTTECKIRLSLVGLIVSQYALLKKSVSNNQLRRDCLISLEKNVGLFNEDVAEKNCITDASLLLEGVAIDKANDGSNTFGVAFNACRNCFPHTAFIEPARAFWKFSCDFPNLRHAGVNQNRELIRPIKKEDAIFVLSYAVLLASFIANNDASQVILSGDF